MIKAVPINPERRKSLLIKIWLYPNVSAFKIAKAIPSAPDWRKNYHDRSFGFACLISTEILILFYAFPHIASTNWKLFVVVINLLHGIPELFMNKHINEMTLDYYSYYSKSLLYFFLFFLMIGAFLLGYTFYNEIGHVK